MQTFRDVTTQGSRLDTKGQDNSLQPILAATDRCIAAVQDEQAPSSRDGDVVLRIAVQVTHGKTCDWVPNRVQHRRR
jgi:hypothetical protein